MTCSEVLPRSAFIVTAGKFTRICTGCAGLGGQKRCIDCKQTKEVEDFRLIKRRNGGEPYREKRCYSCFKAARKAAAGKGWTPREDKPMNERNYATIRDYSPPPTAEQLAELYRSDCASANKPRWGVVPVYVVD